MPITDVAGADTVYFDAYANKIPIAVLAFPSGGAILPPVLIANATGFAATYINDDDAMLLAGPSGILQYENGTNLLMTLTGFGTSMSVTHGDYSSIVFLYMDAPEIYCYETVRFRTNAGQATYDDTQLRGMPIAFGIYNNIILDPQEGDITQNGSQITINAAIIPGGIVAGMPLIIVPQNKVNACAVSVAGQNSYKLPYSNVPNSAMGYVIYGRTIVSPLDYTSADNGDGSSTLTFTNMPPIATGLQIIVCAANNTTETWTTVEGGDEYTSAAINGIFPMFCFYGGSVLTTSQYSISGPDITITPGPPITGGQKLVIQKV